MRLDFAAKHTLSSMATPQFYRNRARLAAPLPHELHTLKEGLKTEYYEITERDWLDGPDQLTLELQEFVASVSTGSAPRVSGEHGLRAVQVADMVLKAASDGPRYRVAA